MAELDLKSETARIVERNRNIFAYYKNLIRTGHRPAAGLELTRNFFRAENISVGHIRNIIRLEKQAQAAECAKKHQKKCTK